MKYKIYFALALLFCLFSCSEGSCPTVCTTDFVTVTVKYKDHAGNDIMVENFKAVNQRTGELYFQPPNFQVTRGTYIVASDANRLGLSSRGDTINVTAVNAQTNESKSTKFVISGGDCACHIEKKAGPDVVIFN